jgi:hypothetical protein
MGRRFNLFKKKGTKGKQAEASAAPKHVDFCIAQKSEEDRIPVIASDDEIDNNIPIELSNEEIVDEEEKNLKEEDTLPVTSTSKDQDRIIDLKKVLASSQEQRMPRQKDGTEETSTIHQDDYTSTSDSIDEDDSIAHLWRFIGCTPKLRSTFSVMHDDESTIQSLYSFMSINDASIISNVDSHSLRKNETKNKPPEQKSLGFWDRILCGSSSIGKPFQ